MKYKVGFANLGCGLLCLKLCDIYSWVFFSDDIFGLILIHLYTLWIIYAQLKPVDVAYWYGDHVHIWIVQLKGYMSQFPQPNNINWRVT